MKTGTVYTETTIYAAPRQFVADAPYQLIIVTLNDGSKLTGRVTGLPVVIGDEVQLVEEREGVSYFLKSDPPE